MLCSVTAAKQRNDPANLTFNKFLKAGTKVPVFFPGVKKKHKYERSYTFYYTLY